MTNTKYTLVVFDIFYNLCRHYQKYRLIESMTNMFNPSDRVLSAEMENVTSFEKFRLDQDCCNNCQNKPDGSFESSLASSFSEAGPMEDSAIMSLPCMMLSTERIHLEQWKWSYRGEGAANLVISLQVSQ